MQIALIALVACDPDGASERVASPPGEAVSPAVDTGHESDDPEPTVPEIGCGLNQAWSAVQGALQLDWCTRLSPEDGSISDYALPDTAEPLDTGGTSEPDPGHTDGPPPPCGFTNLAGNLSLAGGRVLYCDADVAGGTRLASFSAGGAASIEMLASGDCVPDPAAGQLVVGDLGLIAAWAGTSGRLVDDTGEVEPAGLSLARIDEAGAVVAGPNWTALPSTAHRVALAGGESNLAAGLDYDGTLTLLAHDENLVTTLSSAVATSVAGFSMVADGVGGAFLAVCPSDDSSLALSRVDRSLRVVASVTIDEASCGLYARPSLARHRDQVLVGWIGGAGAGVVALDTALVEQWRLPTAGNAGPQVARGGDRWVILGGDGALSTVSAAGEVLATAWHPGIVDADGSVVDLRLSIEGNSALVILYGLSTYPLVTGHVNTFNYVEASRVRLP